MIDLSHVKVYTQLMLVSHLDIGVGLSGISDKITRFLSSPCHSMLYVGSIDYYGTSHYGPHHIENRSERSAPVDFCQIIFKFIGESYESCVRKRALVKYQYQSEMIKVML